jgi:hypothetical protein
MSHFNLGLMCLTDTKTVFCKWCLVLIGLVKYDEEQKPIYISVRVIGRVITWENVKVD